MAEDEGKQEVEEEAKADETDPFMDALSEIDIDPEDLKEEVEEKETKEEGKGAQQISDTEIASLRASHDELLRKNKDLNKALHEERQSKKTAKAVESEAVLSDADLAKIIAEHKDDPAVLLNAVAYKAQQVAKSTKKEAIDEVEIKNKQGELNRILQERYGDSLNDEAGPLRQTVNKVKDYLGLQDHPYGEALSVAGAVFLNLPTLLKQHYEKGVKDAESGTVEKNRQKSIKDGQQFFKSGKGEKETKEKGLSESEMETAKRLGFKPGSPQWKIYQTQIKRAKAA